VSDPTCANCERVIVLRSSTKHVKWGGQELGRECTVRSNDPYKHCIRQTHSTRTRGLFRIISQCSENIKRSFFFLLLPLWSIGLISQFHDNFTDARTSWTGGQLVARPLPIHRTTKHRINLYTHQISMPCVGFEPTTPASERAKIVHVSDRSATMKGKRSYTFG
jgi:hypothetical protein